EVNNYKVPTTIGNMDTNIVYNITKKPASLTVSVYDKTTGKYIEQNKVVEKGVYGDSYKNYEYAAPKGYKIVEVTNQINNGKVTTVSENDLKNQTLNGEDHVVYIIQKEYKNTVIVNIDGKTSNIVPKQEGNLGLTGDKTQVVNPKIPKGYKILGITVDDKPVPSNEINNYQVPKVIGNRDTNIVYNITKIVNSDDINTNQGKSDIKPDISSSVTEQENKNDSLNEANKDLKIHNENTGNNEKNNKTSIVNQENSSKVNVITSLPDTGIEASLKKEEGKLLGVLSILGIALLFKKKK
ncbi:MAG: hypothetical protein ACRCTZ_23610, partial [Sarcina sp.]